MIAAVADTHTVVWYLFGDSRLSVKARTTIDEAASAGRRVAVAAITLAELVYLIEKDRLDAGVLAKLYEALDDESVLVEAPFNKAVAQAMETVRRDQVPDLPDRMIAATAVMLRVPLISRDGKIQASDVSTIW